MSTYFLREGQQLVVDAARQLQSQGSERRRTGGGPPSNQGGGFQSQASGLTHMTAAMKDLLHPSLPHKAQLDLPELKVSVGGGRGMRKICTSIMLYTTNV